MTEFHHSLSDAFADKGSIKLLQASEVLDAVTSSFFITNKNLQIVYVNKKLTEETHRDLHEGIIGLRPGDLFQCIHAHKAPQNCGTTEHCNSCTFKKCLDDAFENKEPVSQEVVLTNADNKMMAYAVTATPFSLEESEFVSVSSLDVTDRYKRNLLESLFFHDLINLSGSLTGYLDVIKNFPIEEIANHIPHLKQIADQILDEIICQRQVTRAEQNNLEADISEINMKEFISGIKDQIIYQACAKNRICNIEFSDDNLTIFSDSRILDRVLLNLLKNAAEKTQKGGIFTLKIDHTGDDLTFIVHNHGAIDKKIRNHIFEFGNTDKGKGHGLGTYSVRLLGENILKGKTWFTTSEEEGTFFYLKIPIVHPALQEHASIF